MAKVGVVTGANRGIGLEFCRQLKAKGFRVYGACRKPSADLEKLGVTVVPNVDVGRDGGCAELSKALQATKVDLLVCNAGVLREDNVGSLDKLDSLREQFEVNSLGPLRTFKALESNLQPGSKLCIITSRMGSIADNGSGGEYGYRMSKAAVNMAGKCLSIDLAGKQIAVGILHPGFVKTDMTAKWHSAPGVIDAVTSVSGMMAVIDSKLTMESTGSFWHTNGEELPW